MTREQTTIRKMAKDMARAIKGNKRRRGEIMSEERAKYGHEVFKSNMVTPGAVIVGSFWHSSVVTIELFADDLTEEAKKKFKDKSVWNENWDTFPLAILEFDNEDEE